MIESDDDDATDDRDDRLERPPRGKSSRTHCRRFRTLSRKPRFLWPPRREALCHPLALIRVSHQSLPPP